MKSSPKVRNVMLTQTGVAELSDKIRVWLEAVSREGDLPSGIQAIYISILDGEASWLLRLSGSREYDPGNSGWACNQDYVPHHEYLDCGLPLGTDWQQLEQAVGDALHRMRDSAGPAVLRQARHISFGLASGRLLSVV